VVGYGSATKDQVQRMVASLLGLAAPPSPPDVADALALAICQRDHHAAARRGGCGLGRGARHGRNAMIGSLRGSLAAGRRRARSSSRWGASGTGSVTTSTMSALGASGSEVFFHVHTHVREDAIVL